MDFGETQYAHAGDIDIAYRVFGDGPMNLVIVPGVFSHLDLFFTFDLYCDFMERFAAFGRVATFDKRGTGLSDPTPGAAQLDARMDDIRAVMDATGMEHAAIIGISEGARSLCCSPPPTPNGPTRSWRVVRSDTHPPARNSWLFSNGVLRNGDRDPHDRALARPAKIQRSHPPIDRFPRAGVGEPSHGEIDHRLRHEPGHPPDSLLHPSAHARRSPRG